MFLHDTPENWSSLVHFFPYAHITQPLSDLHVSPNETFFHTQTYVPLNFQMDLSRNQFRECTAQYCSDLPPQFYYQSTDINSLFHSTMLKPFSTCFLAIETAILQIYSKVYQYALKKFPLHIQCKLHPILMKHYHRIHLLSTEISQLFNFQIN